MFPIVCFQFGKLVKQAYVLLGEGKSVVWEKGQNVLKGRQEARRLLETATRWRGEPMKEGEGRKWMVCANSSLRAAPTWKVHPNS